MGPLRPRTPTSTSVIQPLPLLTRHPVQFNPPWRPRKTPSTGPSCLNPLPSLITLPPLPTNFGTPHTPRVDTKVSRIEGPLSVALTERTVQGDDSRQWVLGRLCFSSDHYDSSLVSHGQWSWVVPTSCDRPLRHSSGIRVPYFTQRTRSPYLSLTKGSYTHTRTHTWVHLGRTYECIRKYL